ncbi:MAG: hypothetical protein ACNA7Q_03770 [Rhodobacterales bacterium]
MKKHNIIGASLALMALPMAAQANSFSLDAGFAANMVVEADGFDHVENTGEGYLEGSYAGFFAGVWIGSLYKDPTDDYELELYLGYGNELSNGFGYSLTYTAYYLEDSYQNYDLTLGLGYAINDAVEIGAEFAYDPDSEDLDSSVFVSYAFSDAISAYALIGQDMSNDMYGELGVSYAFTDEAAFSLLYENAESADATISFILSYDFNVFGG